MHDARVRGLTVVAVGVAVAATCARGSFAAPVPVVEQQRIVAEFGRMYLPRFMPRGYIYIRWKTQLGSASAYGEWPTILFGNHGRSVQWTVENTRDSQSQSDVECVQHSHWGPGTKVFCLNGMTVYYAEGAVGQTATVCLPNHRGLVVWNDYSLSARTLAMVAASARAVG